MIEFRNKPAQAQSLAVREKLKTTTEPYQHGDEVLALFSHLGKQGTDQLVDGLLTLVGVSSLQSEHPLWIFARTGES